MPSPLEFLIRVIADTRGATDAQAALKQVQDAAGAAALDTIAGAQRSSQAEQQQAAATRDAAKALEEKASAAAAAAVGPDLASGPQDRSAPSDQSSALGDQATAARDAAAAQAELREATVDSARTAADAGADHDALATQHGVAAAGARDQAQAESATADGLDGAADASGKYAGELEKVSKQADAATATLRAHAEQLQQLIEKTAAAGGNTAVLEQQLTAVKGEAITKWLTAYKRGLGEVIVQQQQAGQDVTGLQAILGEVSATTKAAEAQKKLGDQMEIGGNQLRRFQRLGIAGDQVLGGLARAAGGGAGAFLGLAQAARGVIGSLVAVSGPVGITVAVLSTLAGVLLTLSENNKEAEESFIDTAKAATTAKEAYDQGKSAAEDLGKVELTTLRKQITDLDGESASAANRLKEILAAAAEIEDARRAARVAGIESDFAAGKITQRERDERVAAERDQAERDRLQAPVTTRSVDESRALEAAAQARGRELQGRAAAERAQAESEAATTRQADLKIEQEKLKAERRTQAQIASSEDPAASSAAGKRVEEIDARLKVIGTELITVGSRIGFAGKAYVDAFDLATQLAKDRAAADEKLRDAIEARVRAEETATRKLSALNEQKASEGTVRTITADKREADAAEEGAQTKIRLANQDVGARARRAGQNAAVDPRLTEPQRELAAGLVQSARKAEETGTTESLRELDTAVSNFGQTFVGQSQTVVEFLLKLREEIRAAGRASLELDTKVKARDRAKEEAAIATAVPPQSAPSNRPTVPPSDRAAPLPPSDRAPQAPPVTVDVTVNVDKDGAAATSEVTTTPIPRRARGGGAKAGEPVVVTDDERARDEIFVPNDPSQPAQKLSGSGPTVFTPPSDGMIIASDQLPNTVPTPRGAPGVAFGSTPQVPTPIVDNAPNFSTIGTGDASQPNTSREQLNTIPTPRGAPGVAFGSTPQIPTTPVDNAPGFSEVRTAPFSPLPPVKSESDPKQAAQEKTEGTEARSPRPAPVLRPTTDVSQAKPPAQAERTPQADRTPTASDPVNDGVIRSNAAAIQRTEEKSAEFRADPANAPKPPRPPTPPKPAGDKRTRAEFKADFQAAAEQTRRLDGAVSAAASPVAPAAGATADDARSASSPPSPSPRSESADRTREEVARAGAQTVAAVDRMARELMLARAQASARDAQIISLLGELRDRSARTRVASLP